MAEYKGGSKNFKALMDEVDALEIEKVGKQIRKMSGLEK
jgi:ketol-acid reductoisomerase